MASLNSITRFLNKELNIKKIDDSSRNGLQVRTKNDVKKIGFAVDASISTFKKAKKCGVNLVIVHHGIKWNPQKYRELSKKRIEFLEKNNISLYGAHLPLDLHKKWGNNIRLAKLLNLKNIRKFGNYKGVMVGYSGNFDKSIDTNKVSKILDKKLKTKCMVLNFGKKKIKSIGICSGGGADLVDEAVRKKLDCYLVGEINHGAFNRIRDYKINTIVAGHYATETVGVKALMPILEKKFGVKTIFIDNPPGF